MNRHGKKLSKWRLMGAGALSVTFRRVFVIALTAVSLAVWTITVIGMGVLRQGSGLGGTVKTAEAAEPLLSPKEAAAAIEWATHEETPAAEDVQAADPVAPALWASPSRNPFAPDRGRYPLSAKSARAKQKGGDADKQGRFDRNRLVPLQLEGTLALGKQKVAIMHGNSFDFGGRTMLLMLKDVRGNDTAIAVKDVVVTHFKVGDTIEARPVTDADGQVRINDELLKFGVQEITSRSVTLSLGKQTHVLEMKK